MSRSEQKPSGAARMFGATLRHFRERAGLSRKELADIIQYAESTVFAFESGRRVPQAETVKVLDERLGAQGALLVGVEELEKDDRFPEFFEEFADYEADCMSLSVFGTMAIPGLLQTEAYARATLSAHCPALDDDLIERRVQARLDRQTLLTRRPAAVISFVIDEAACRRLVGGPDVMREQLRHIVACAQMRNVSIQVLPLNTPDHCGLDGPMILITTGEGRDLAYIEGQSSSQWVSERSREQLHGLTQRYGKLREQALSTGDSIKLIERIAGEL